MATPSPSPARRPLRRLRRAALTTALAAALATTLTQPSLAEPSPAQAPAPADPPLARTQTSDGVIGPIAAAREAGVGVRSGSPRTTAPLRTVRSSSLAPGVWYRHFVRTDARGRIRGYLLSVSLGRRGVSVDYAGGADVRATAPVSRLTREARAIAGVNGDFFDIGATGAPQGVGQARGDSLQHAPTFGWNTALSIDAAGTARIGEVPMIASIAEFPDLPIAGLNQPRVRGHRIGVYTPRWGRLVGAQVADASSTPVRTVVIRNGRVVLNTTALHRGSRLTDRVLIGRGQGAEALRAMTVGSKATLRVRLARSPRMAISGNLELLRGGRVLAWDDGQMHPRTAVGIDRDRNALLMLVVDGRQAGSRGLTERETAELMRQLGAEHALNLDGGGSSTLVGGRRGVNVLNHPSDGSQRSVSNALVVRYRP